jgi:hypothetical protein
MDLPRHRPFAQWRFLQLTLAIVAWMLVAPHLSAKLYGHLAVHVMLFDLMLVTLWANPSSPGVRRAVIALWVLSVVASIAAALGISHEVEQVDRTLQTILNTPIFAACAFGVVVFAFRAERPTVDGIFAMVVVYLVIAMLFAQFYYLALVWNPDALHLLQPFDQMTLGELRSELVYFSLVTISTVGYGDIVPSSSTTRMLAAIEAVIGQFYVAVVVAMFIGMYASQAYERRTGSKQSAGMNDPG